VNASTTRRFILNRLAAMVMVLLTLTLIVFVLQRLVPGDPARATLGRRATPELIAKEHARLGLDDPVPVQYLRYINALLHGDLGTSVSTKRPVTQDLGDYVPASLELFAFSMFLAIIGGLVLGLLSWRRGWLSAVIRWVMLAGAAAPVFLLGLVGILIFYSRLGWLPSSGRTSDLTAPTGPTKLLIVDSLIHGRFDVAVDGVKHLLMPALCLAIGAAVAIGRVLRSSMVHVMRADYVRTARSIGLAEWRIIFQHALRNCLNGALAMTGLMVGAMFVGLAVVEQVFSYPGLGQYMNKAITADDLPAIMGVALVTGAIYVVANAVVDMLQVVADPRIALARS
jgi:peptide/nickel transport system permease protein